MYYQATSNDDCYVKTKSAGKNEFSITLANEYGYPYFCRNFTVYGRLRRDTARFCAVCHRNPGDRNTGRLRYRDCIVYGRMYAVFSLDTVVNHDPGLE